MASKTGVSGVVAGLVLAIIVLSSALGVLFYEYSSSSSPLPEQTSVATIETTLTSTQTVISTKTVTEIASGSEYVKQSLPANFPTTCLENYPSGFNLNSSTYFIISNFTMNFAQICMKYAYYPQNDSSLTTNGSFDANFTGSMYITDSFGNASQGGPYPYDAVYAFPEQALFNSTGESIIVVYDFQWSFIFSYFFPQYVRCGSSLFGIGIAQTNGDGSSGLNTSCPAFTDSDLFLAQLVGTSYLKPAIG